MSAIDFPNSPSLNEVFTVGNRSWTWTGAVWQTVTTQLGNQGDKGGLKYLFDDSTVMGLPALGSIRFNSSTISSVNSLAIRAVNQDGQDVSDYIISQTGSTSVINSYMIVQSNVNGDSTYAIFTIGSVTDNSTWLEVGATYVAGTLPENNEVLSVSFYRVGDVGPTGPETSISIGTVTTSLPGENAEVSVTGPAGDQVLDITLPQGPTGPETTISLGTVTTGTPGGTAEVSITGPAGDQELSFTIPQGPTGPGGTYNYQVSPTAPEGVNPEGLTEGDTWFNAETGRFYIYYDGYWIENTSNLIGAIPGSGVDGITAISPILYDNETYVISLDESAILPDQDGNAGKYLTTDGTDASWSAILPDQDGNVGKYLTTDGTDASWSTITTDPNPQIFLMMGA